MAARQSSRSNSSSIVFTVNWHNEPGGTVSITAHLVVTNSNGLDTSLADAVQQYLKQPGNAGASLCRLTLMESMLLAQLVEYRMAIDWESGLLPSTTRVCFGNQVSTAST